MLSALPVCACSVVFNSLQTQELWPAMLRCPWSFPDKNTGVSCHFLFQGIFWTRGSNPHPWHLLYWPPGHLGSPVNHYKTMGDRAWRKSEQSGPGLSEAALEADWDSSLQKSSAAWPPRVVSPWVVSTQGEFSVESALLSLPLLPDSFCSPLTHIPSGSLFPENSRPICISTASQSLICKFTGDPFHIPCDSLEGHSSGPKIHLSTEKSDAHPEGTPQGSLKT